MRQKIPCFCGNTFFVEVPEEINLDENPGYFDELRDGTFMNFVCPKCGKVHKPEFAMKVTWPSRGVTIDAQSELNRAAVMLRRPEKKKGAPDAETAIGYPELAERLAILKDGLEPAAIEALKYLLLLKADESCPGRDVTVEYQLSTSDAIEFRIRGIREGEDGISRLPRRTYETTLEDIKKHPKKDLYKALRSGSYLSVRNLMRTDFLGTSRKG